MPQSATSRIQFDTANPAGLGTASPGTSPKASRGNHVHPDPKPTKAVIACSVASLGSGTLYCMNGTGSTTENDNTFLCPVAGTLKNLYVNVAVQGSSLAGTITVRKNGADTGITVTTNAAGNGTGSDTSNTVTVAAGDRISFKYVPGTSGNTGIRISLELATT